MGQSENDVELELLWNLEICPAVVCSFEKVLKLESRLWDFGAVIYQS
jgi:hypothetical protein